MCVRVVREMEVEAEGGEVEAKEVVGGGGRWWEVVGGEVTEKEV